jgi:hypothetical protein
LQYLDAQRTTAVPRGLTVRVVAVEQEREAVHKPAPQAPGVVEDLPVDVAALEQAFNGFLVSVTDMEHAVSNWLTQMGPTSWVLMGLALLGSAFGIVRKHQARRGRLVAADDGEARPDWVV